MSVIVKGMEMPNIPAFREKDNKVAFPAAVVLEKGKAPRLVVNYKIGYVDTNLKAYELVEVPTPHGRLIDADELIRYLNEWISDPVALSGFTRIINHQPTIIEALEEAGFHTDDVFQGTNLSPIMDEFEGLLKDRKIHIGDNELLKKQLLDVAAKYNDVNERKKPVKLETRLHIDGPVSVLDAFTVRSKYYKSIGKMLQNAKSENSQKCLNDALTLKRPPQSWCYVQEVSEE